jgi:hypothetical protein
MEALEQALAKHSNSANGLLKTRQEIDDWFKMVKGEQGFNKQGPMVDAVKAVRNH